MSITFGRDRSIWTKIVFDFNSTMEFTPQEKAKLVLLFERCDRSYSDFRKRARSELGLRPNALPPVNTLKYWIERFEETGSVNRQNPTFLIMWNTTNLA
jgi:hypothetical protein